MSITLSSVLPHDGCRAALVGRLWIDAPYSGPRPVVLRGQDLFDLSELSPTLSDLFDLADPAAQVRAHEGFRLCSLDEALRKGLLLAPCDLQALKAAGVTFASSLLERILEEKTHGSMQVAQELREELNVALGGRLEGVKPGSDQANAAREVLIRAGMWSQYLEVGIGPDAEIFTKGQPMSAIGCGAGIGLPAESNWSTPEPEVVLAVSSCGCIVGATLGNDFTLRDLEGRSALLLTRAKDNNASCAIGPFVRLFDHTFGLDHVRQAEVNLRIDGPDGFKAQGVHSMHDISRDPTELVAATIGRHHQYPDGLMLFLGTMLVPNADRMGPGRGFTHKVGDIVQISSPLLGLLYNQMIDLNAAPPWTYGARALMRSLVARRVI